MSACQSQGHAASSCASSGPAAAGSFIPPVLPEGEYGVALVAHRTAADFGPVTVEPLAMPPDDAALTQAGLREINSAKDSRGAADRPL